MSHELQHAIDHLALAVSEMREDLDASVYRDLPAGHFARITLLTSRLAIGQHLLAGLRDLATLTTWSTDAAALVGAAHPHRHVPQEPDITVLDGVARSGVSIHDA
jgi:hypothetical protein